MTILVSGGAKNGKSDFAQTLALTLAKGGVHYYVATMIPCDGEDQARIRSHLARREGLGFETIECGRNILSCLEQADPNGTFLLDSVTALMMNELFPADRNYAADEAAAAKCTRDLAVFARSVGSAVFVSDAIYSDAVRYDAATETYRRHLALADRALAQVCDTVLEMSAGNILVHKGALPL